MARLSANAMPVIARSSSGVDVPRCYVLTQPRRHSLLRVPVVGQVLRQRVLSVAPGQASVILEHRRTASAGLGSIEARVDLFGFRGFSHGWYP